ncbi:MAG: SDR family oxidoreductase [Candidatus Hermodarchaeota archaeon]
MIIFITGTNRGLGLEFVKQYLKRGEDVIATCRKPDKAVELQSLKNHYNEKLTILQLEVTNQKSRDEAYEKVKQKFKKIDFLINNAGIRSGGEKNSYTLGELHKEDIGKVFQVNSISPLLLIEKFLDLVEKSDTPKIINITSGLGSIGRKTMIFRYSYCASKSALNMFSKMMSIELKSKGIIVLALHPGHVKTDLGGSYAPLLPQQSISGMIKVIDSLTLEDTGKYLDWQRNEIPW